ncbi:MAG: PQQ-binding-like beta-propeller repeat protein [Candidatus Hinthialibacter antarcticus]|nr:PQQ-binding-like beta-propeller repeat protein [Candidatus Hinthialibacter antarcticus]
MRILLLTLVLSISAFSATADDWTTYQHDNRRSGVSLDQVKWPLELAWNYSAPTPPQTAWPAPARWDAYAKINDLKSMRDFDPVFYVIAVNGSLYFSTSVEDCVVSSDAETGEINWRYFTNAPVRFAPTWNNGKLYFGSDDGFAYCVDATNGELVWKFHPAPDGRLIPSNGKMISPWPIRTGVLVQDGLAYFGASLVPWGESYLCAVDAESGEIKQAGTYNHTLRGVTFQGAILASDSNLYISQGRQHPLTFNRQTGGQIGGFGEGGNGGVFAILTPESTFIHGRGKRKSGDTEFRGFDPNTRDQIATFPNATCMIVFENMAYLHAQGKLVAFDRFRHIALEKKRIELDAQKEQLNERIKKLGKQTVSDEKAALMEQVKDTNRALEEVAKQKLECVVWQTESNHPHTLIMAGDTLFAGGDGEAAAFNRIDGSRLGSVEVEGAAQGLAVYDGKLYVSTDAGSVYSFRSPVLETAP